MVGPGQRVAEDLESVSTGDVRVLVGPDFARDFLVPFLQVRLGCDVVDEGRYSQLERVSFLLVYRCMSSSSISPAGFMVPPFDGACVGVQEQVSVEVLAGVVAAAGVGFAWP
jgi:hypothetical protein